MARNPENNYSSEEYKQWTKYPKRTPKKSTYFFIDGVLHKKLRVNRSTNLVTCIKYPENEMVTYPWTDVKKYQQKAYRLSEVAYLINRSPRRIYEAFMREAIPFPAKAIGKNGNRYWYMFTEQDVMDVRDYFANIHRGRPRKDGMISTVNVPTREQVRAEMGKARLLYVKDDTGEIIPVWLAEEY